MTEIILGQRIYEFLLINKPEIPKYKYFSIKCSVRNDKITVKEDNFTRKQQIFLPVSESRSSFLDGLMVKEFRFMDRFLFHLLAHIISINFWSFAIGCNLVFTLLKNKT